MSVSMDIDRAPINEALTWPERAAAVAITSPESYGTAADLLKGIKALRQRIADTFGPLAKKAYDAHKAIVAEQKSAEEPLAAAERTIKDRMVAWDAEQERIRREEQRRREEEARKAEEARRLEEAAAMEREAVATGSAALQAEAEALISEPIAAPVVLVEKTTPKVAGISYRETCSAEVVSLPQLVAFVAANPQHANLLLPNTVALNQMARAMKTALQIPGVRVVVKRDVAAGSR